MTEQRIYLSKNQLRQIFSRGYTWMLTVTGVKRLNKEDVKIDEAELKEFFESEERIKKALS